MKKFFFALLLLSSLIVIQSCWVATNTEKDDVPQTNTNTSIEYRIYEDEWFQKNAIKVRADLEEQIKANNISNKKAIALREKVEAWLAKKYTERKEK